MRSKNLKSLALLGVAGVAAVFAVGAAPSLPIVGYNNQAYAAPRPDILPSSIIIKTPDEGWTVFEDNLMSAAQPYDKLAVLKAAIQAVDSQIPNWPTWYKIDQALTDLDNSELHDQAVETLRECILIVMPDADAEQINQASDVALKGMLVRNETFLQYGIIDWLSSYTNAPNLSAMYKQALSDVANASSLTDRALINSYVDLMVSAYKYGLTRVIINYSSLPLVGDESNDPGNENKPSTPEEIVEDAKDSISGLNKLAALKAAIAAVDEQIPNWNVWKYVPAAMEQALYGRICWDVNGVAVQCRKSGYSAQIEIIRALIPDTDKDGNDISGWSELPEVVELESKSLPELIAYAKTQSLYTSDASFAELVNSAEQNYDAGVASLKKALGDLTDTENIDSMTAEQLIAALEALPEAQAYGISSDWEMNEESLYWKYADAVFYTNSKLYPNGEYSEDDYKLMSDAYANLVLAATQVKPDFSVNLGTVPVLAPNTGLVNNGEISGTIAKIAVAGIASIAALAGVTVTAKRYAFSPLKRRK